MIRARPVTRRLPAPAVLRRAGGRVRRVPLPLALLLGVAAVLSLSWSLATAQLQGPDENDHVAYVEHLAESGHIPSATTGTGPYAPDELTALYGLGFAKLQQNRLARPPWSGTSERVFRDYEDSLKSGALSKAGGPLSVGKSPPLYYGIEAVGWKLTPGGHFFGRIFVLRLLGCLMLLATVAFSWLLAGEVFRRRFPQTVATGVVALFPMAGFMSGIVNTDNLLITLYAAFLWQAVRTARVGLTWQRAVILSAITVGAVLTHGRGLALVPALGIALLVLWLRDRKPVRETAVVAGSSLATLVAGFVVYRLLNAAGGGGSLYGGEVNLGNKSAFSIRQFLSGVWQFYLPKLDAMIPHLGPPIGYRQLYIQQYFAGVFGSFEVYFPYWVYDTVQVTVAIALLALYTAAIVRREVVIARWPTVVILAGTALSLIFFLHLASYRALVNGSDNPLIVGRYLLPMLPVVGVAVAALVAALPRRAGLVLGTLALCGLFALSIGGLGLSVERFYA
jgi:4-amino-4-deoxy-L-arabinose transferase-like glycosyltransferase